MEVDHTYLSTHFGQLSDEELLAQFGSGNLTDAAKIIAANEIRNRGLQIPVEQPQLPETFDYAGDYEVVARFPNVMNAHVVRSFLESAGVPAVMADTNVVQTYSLVASALGGVRILVQSDYVAKAREIINAFNNGEFALRDADDEPI